ncbi:MAG: fibrobacter succinogenes major paralogous domain-containing protein [Bacteroidota bacterium]
MKKIFTICAAILMAVSVFLPQQARAQAPNKMSYQAVIRDNSNALVTNQIVGMQISILQGSANGTAVYAETQTPTTNTNGLASIEIGAGTVLSGNFAAINWANGPYFIKTETDPAGGTNYTISGTSQLLSVPYSLYSGNGIVGVSPTGDTLYLGNGSHIFVPGISAANNNGGGQIGITQHTCGADSVHNPALTYGSITDQDGNVYKTIVIGTQEWMAENLKSSHYLNGDLIPWVTNEATWGALTTGAACWYNNDSITYNCPYGRLYNWYAVTDTRNVCPTGWHVPSDAEWTTLINHIDTNAVGGSNNNTAGGKMKSTGTQYWPSPNTDATNESGFSGLPGGGRSSNGAFAALIPGIITNPPFCKNKVSPVAETANCLSSLAGAP